MILLRRALGTLLLLLGVGAWAQENGAGLAGELEQGLELLQRGEREQAFVYFERLLDAYRTGTELSSRELAAVAGAARHLGLREPALFKDAVRVYDEAIRKDPNNLDARVALGELLLEKYNNTEAGAVFREVLGIDAEHPGALLGLARSQHFDFSPEALETAKKVLVLDAESAPARAFITRLYIELEQYNEAEAEARRALTADPESLQTLAVLAAVQYLSGDQTGFRETVERALGINPRYAELYNTLAELAAQNRLYFEAAAFAAQAVELDARSWRGYGLLGMNQLRVGEIDAGTANLEKAFAGDPYNVWIKNTLDLADTFAEYELIPKGRFLLFVHRDEAALLAPYLYELAETAYGHYDQRYGYTAKTPIRIEVYPRHADFSVRTVGLAGMGLLGVSFGPVVALDSPSARERGQFNWGSTLWHELAHTFHLGMTAHRVPRWFSEGLAVYEERQARPGWGGDVTPDFLQAYQAGRLPPVSLLNNGFVRPSYPEQIVHSYYQASLVLDFIERDWGAAAVRDMLAGFRRGLATAQVIEQTLELAPADFDRAFDNYFRERFAGPLRAIKAVDTAHKPPATAEDLLKLATERQDDFALQLRAGRVLLKQDEPERAEVFLLRAQALFPQYAGDNSPYWHLAQLYEKQGRAAQAAQQLARMAAINGEHYDAHVKLAELRRGLSDPSGAADALERAIYIYPFDILPHETLAELYAGLGQWPLAVRERRAVVALAPVDMAEARYRLAEAHFNNAAPRAARREVLRALELAPSFDAALDLLLEIRAQATESD